MREFQLMRECPLAACRINAWPLCWPSTATVKLWTRASCTQSRPLISPLTAWQSARSLPRGWAGRCCRLFADRSAQGARQTFFRTHGGGEGAALGQQQRQSPPAQVRVVQHHPDNRDLAGTWSPQRRWGAPGLGFGVAPPTPPYPKCSTTHRRPSSEVA